MLNIALARVTELQTTALYYERALQAAGHSITVINEIEDKFDHQPFDFLLTVDPCLSGIAALSRIECPTALVLIDVHQDLPTRLLYSRFCDHVFVAQPDYLPRISEGRGSVHWLPLGADLDVHCVLGLERDIDVGFVGKLGRPGSDRHAVLTQVLGRFATNDTTRPQTPWEMGRTYSRSRIVFNKSINGDVNMRFFEAMASGALLVTDRIGNGMPDLAQEGVHYVGYDTADEAVAQIERYLSDAATRQRIASAGQALVTERHTYRHRVETIISTVQTTPGRHAPARNVTDSQLRLWRAAWARRRGIAPVAAMGLLAEGLSPTGYSDLAVGVARAAKHRLNRLWRE